MKIYRIEFRGTAYMPAESKEIAQEIFLNDLFMVDIEEAEAEAFEEEDNDLDV